MVVLDRILNIIDNKLTEIPSPEVATVINTNYTNSTNADVEFSNGDILTDVPTLNYPRVDSPCIIIYLQNDPNQPFCIPTTNNDTEIMKAMGVGAFTIKDNHLYVDLPVNLENPFKLENGHLYIDTSKTNVEPTRYTFMKNHLFYEED